MDEYSGNSGTSDEAIAVAVQQGDRNQFGVLVDRYEAKLFRYGRRFLSNPAHLEDIVQDIFLKTYENIRSFDSSQRFSPWIYRIAHNTFVNALKKESRSPLLFIDFDTLVAHPTYDDPSEAERERKELRAAIDQGLEKLSPREREVIVLFYLEELSYKEISDVLRVPIGTVGVRLKRAKETLKKFVTNN